MESFLFLWHSKFLFNIITLQKGLLNKNLFFCDHNVGSVFIVQQMNPHVFKMK